MALRRIHVRRRTPTAYRSPMTTPTPWCSVATVLTAEEQATLEALDGDHQVEDTLHCEIQQGHDGHPHMSLGQALNPDEWWLVWDDDGVRDLKVLPPCEVEDPTSTHQCVLPLYHPGRCGFALD